MGLIIGGASASDLILDGKSVSLYVGGNPPTKVWPTAVQIPLGADLEARDQFRAALADRGLNYQTVEEIPFDIELVGIGSARELFRGCAALTSVPPMDTSGVTSMRSMFNGCEALTSVPDMDTSGVTNMGWMFQDCSSLTTVPWMDTSNVTEMSSMFRACASLTSVPDLDTSSATNMGNMFTGCSALTHAPSLDTSQVTNMGSMFWDCLALTHVPDMDTSNVPNTRYMFYDCAALTDGNVRLIGRHPDVDTTGMIGGSGLTREPFYTADGQPWPEPRVVTLQTNYVGGFNKTTTGDADLIGGWQNTYSGEGVFFSAPVTCSRNLESLPSGSAISAGTTVPTGTVVGPEPGTSAETSFVFTEVL